MRGITLGRILKPGGRQLRSGGIEAKIMKYLGNTKVGRNRNELDYKIGSKSDFSGRDTTPNNRGVHTTEIMDASGPGLVKTLRRET